MDMAPNRAIKEDSKKRRAFVAPHFVADFVERDAQLSEHICL